jgi:threonine synthase
MPLQINPNVSLLRCSWSGQELPGKPFSTPVGLCRCCPAPGKPVVVEYDAAKVLAELRGTPLAKRDGAGIWRYAPLLPVLGVPDEYARRRPDAHGEARAWSRQLAVEVSQNEGLPSGSATRPGGRGRVAACGEALPSHTGNASPRAVPCLGMTACQVWMPEGFEGSIYHKGCEFFGGEVRFAGPNIAAAGRAMRERLAHELSTGEVVDISTFFEPGRLEGKKTMGLEIADQFAGRRLPDLVFYPTGGGTGLVGIWKAFTELSALGLLDRHHARLPRMVACSRSTVTRLSRRSTKASTRSCR